MTFQQFTQLLFEVAKGSITVHNARKGDASAEYWERSRSYVQPRTAEEITREAWLVGEKVETGGAHGGSCWGDGARAYSVGSPQPVEIKALDTILERINPNITLLKYRKLASQKIFDTHESTNNEYYGNYTNYIQKYVKVGDLFDALVELGVIS